MFTFTDQIELAQEISGDRSTGQLVKFKRDINEGGTMFLNRLGRKFNKEYKTTDLKDGQQYYQFSADILRISRVICPNGTRRYRPSLITSEDEWNALNTLPVSGNYPIYYYIRGFNEVGIYPIPNADITNGLEVSYEPQHVELTQDDYTSGTVTVSSNESTVVTHSASGFTESMVGRWLQVTDGTDGRWYKITSYVSSSVINLENYYEGIGGTGRTFRIGEIMRIPQGYQDAPVYYALHRFYIAQGDMNKAKLFMDKFNDLVKSAKETYGHSTSQLGVKSIGLRRKPRWIDLTPPVIYP